jgi:hypothetical protein
MTALVPGQSFSGWRVAQLDAVGKRAWVRCERCDGLQQASVEALLDASLKPCECGKRPSPQPPSPPPSSSSFSRGIAAEETFSAMKGRRR